jgi:hypothetical protein
MEFETGILQITIAVVSVVGVLVLALINERFIDSDSTYQIKMDKTIEFNNEYGSDGIEYNLQTKFEVLHIYDDKVNVSSWHGLNRIELVLSRKVFFYYLKKRS